jgi:hypothetical protein
MAINPVPAGKMMSAVSAVAKHACEICGAPALMTCDCCDVTHYCGKEHQTVDWYQLELFHHRVSVQ